MIKRLSIICFLTFSIPLLASNGKIPELSPEELENVLQKNLVVKTKQISNNSPWPQVTVYTSIDTLPAEALSVFATYDDHRKFVPDLIISKSIKKVAKNDTWVSFEIENPWPIPNTRYTTGNVINRINNHGYEVRWYLVKSEHIKETRGRAQFLELGGKTLFIYQTFVHPDSMFAPLFKGIMISNVKATIKSTVHYIESLKSSSPETVKTYQNRVLSTLNGDKNTL